MLIRRQKITGRVRRNLEGLLQCQFSVHLVEQSSIQGVSLSKGAG